MKYWVLTDETPRQNTEEPGWALVGVFSTKEKALAWLAAKELGAEEFADLVWEAFSPAFYTGERALTDLHYVLAQVDVDKGEP